MWIPFLCYNNNYIKNNHESTKDRKHETKNIKFDEFVKSIHFADQGKTITP